MVSFHLQKSGTIRLYITINKERHRISTKFKVSPTKWSNQRVVGKNSILINKELDRISEEIEIWVATNPVNNYLKKSIDSKIKQIINNSTTVEIRKGISDYHDEYLKQKSCEINPMTKKMISKEVIGFHRNALRRLLEWKDIELDVVDKIHYNEFLSHLLKTDSVNHSGKIVSNLKSFFSWCDKSGYLVNSQYKFWKSISEESNDVERALNIDQLRRIYELEIDELRVWEIAKKEMGKKPNNSQMKSLLSSIEEARRQAVAIASIGTHREDFWALTDRNVYGNLIKYNRGKNNIKCIAPFIDNDIFHAREFANLEGGHLFKRITKINEYLKYIRVLCDIPFHITTKTFRKTWGSIIWFEIPDNRAVNKMAVLMKGYGHKSESTTRQYLGIQDDDLLKDHELLFS